MFDLSRLTPNQQAIIVGAIEATDFPWEQLKPGLEEQTGKDRIPVLFRDLSRDALAVEGGHAHIHVGGDVGHPILSPSRKRTLGLAWYSGKVEVDQSLESQPLLAQEVFLAEGAHMIDFFWMSELQRRAIFLLMHGGVETEHGHTWFDNPSYWDDVGESFMGLFVMAYAPSIPVELGGFSHRPTPELAKQVREILTPATSPPPVLLWGYVGNRKTAHHGSCWVYRLAIRLGRPVHLAAFSPGDRACKRCRPEVV